MEQEAEVAEEEVVIRADFTRFPSVTTAMAMRGRLELCSRIAVLINDPPLCRTG